MISYLFELDCIELKSSIVTDHIRIDAFRRFQKILMLIDEIIVFQIFFDSMRIILYSPYASVPFHAYPIPMIFYLSVGLEHLILKVICDGKARKSVPIQSPGRLPLITAKMITANVNNREY